MSLLMEALKKAEEAKRRASEASPSGTDEPAATPLTLEPLTPPPRPTPPGSPLPDLAQHSASVDADLAAAHTDAPLKRRPNLNLTPPPKAPLAPPADTADRAAARNAFAAKRPAPPRNALWLALGAGGLAAISMAAYFWWQLQGLGGHPLNATNTPLTAPPAIPSTPSPARAITPPSAAPVPMAAPVAAPVQTPAIAEAAPPALFQPATVKAPAKPSAAQSRPDRPAPAQTSAPPPPRPDAPPSTALRLSRSAAQSPIELAYSALQAGQFAEAQRYYEQALRHDRKNTDALLGLATLAAQQGQNERAQALYQQALESDPNDPTAQAGVLSTRGQADPGLSESRLKTALAAQPDSPALLFALGNLYARQMRWSEAQPVYFRAYSTEPDNPDFIFNLAVSLDQLRQPKLAAQYYRMALSASEAQTPPRAAAFDRASVRKRIGELQPTPN